jgi:DUF971 family protein
MKNPDSFPVNVDVDRARQVMEVEWEGGHHSAYPAERLRWACPCAECRGEAGAQGRLSRVKNLPDDELRVKDVALVGQYALQIAFESGHATGLYSFTYLRGLCDCEECQARKSTA